MERYIRTEENWISLGWTLARARGPFDERMPEGKGEGK